MKEPNNKSDANYHIIEATKFLDPFYCGHFETKNQFYESSNINCFKRIIAKSDESSNQKSQSILKISQPSFNAKDQQDARKMFLLSLLPDVSIMSETQMRKFRKGVVDLVDRVLLNKDDSEEAEPRNTNCWIPINDDESGDI